MGPKKGRRVRNTGVHTDSVPEFAGGGGHSGRYSVEEGGEGGQRKGGGTET